MVLKQIMEQKREGKMGDWRKLRVEGTHDLFSSLNTTGDDQVKKSEAVGTCSTNKKEKCSHVFDGVKLKEKIFERCRHSWKGDTKVHLKEMMGGRGLD
jgi:hypothetical protein